MLQYIKLYCIVSYHIILYYIIYRSIATRNCSVDTTVLWKTQWPADVPQGLCLWSCGAALHRPSGWYGTHETWQSASKIIKNHQKSSKYEFTIFHVTFHSRYFMLYSIWYWYSIWYTDVMLGCASHVKSSRTCGSLKQHRTQAVKRLPLRHWFHGCHMSIC